MNDLWRGGRGHGGAQLEPEPEDEEEEEDERDTLPRGRRGRVKARVRLEPTVQLVDVARGLVVACPPLEVRGRGRARREAFVLV